MIISCKRPIDDPELLKLVNRQIHRHLTLVEKMSHNVVSITHNLQSGQQKFFSPWTLIWKREVECHKQNWKSIEKQLNDMKEGEDVTFDQLLLNLKITEQNYFLGVRSGLNTPYF